MMFLKRRQKDYEGVFSTVQGRHVLADLHGFCAAGATSFSKDALEMARNEGRREVWLHIQSVLRMNPEEIDAMLRDYRRVRQQEEAA